MSKQFVKGNVYVFSKKAFLRDKRKKGCSEISWRESKGWVNHINGREISVQDEFSGNVSEDFLEYFVVPEWCKCIKNKTQQKEK